MQEALKPFHNPKLREVILDTKTGAGAGHRRTDAGPTPAGWV